MLHGGLRRSGRRVGPGDPLTGGGYGVAVPCDLDRLVPVAGAEADPITRCPNPIDAELSGPDVIGWTTAEVQQPDLVTEPRAGMRHGDTVRGGTAHAKCLCYDGFHHSSFFTMFLHWASPLLCPFISLHLFGSDGLQIRVCRFDSGPDLHPLMAHTKAPKMLTCLIRHPHQLSWPSQAGTSPAMTKDAPVCVSQSLVERERNPTKIIAATSPVSSPARLPVRRR